MMCLFSCVTNNKEDFLANHTVRRLSKKKVRNVVTLRIIAFFLLIILKQFLTDKVY